jgi:hypothetical protein
MAVQNVITTAPTLGRRREARLRVRLATRLIGLDGSLWPVLADLSTSGARLKGNFDMLRVGADAVLAWDRFEAFGVVVWRDADQCGLRFYEPISRAELIATREIDDHDRLPNEHELARRAAGRFVSGNRQV